jgi:hypothetical protein
MPPTGNTGDAAGAMAAVAGATAEGAGTPRSRKARCQDPPMADGCVGVC